MNRMILHHHRICSSINGCPSLTLFPAQPLYLPSTMLARTVASSVKTAATRRVSPTHTLRLFASTVRAADPAKEVEQTTQLWMDTVTSGKDDAPTRTAALYAKDAAFWPTVSKELRIEPQEVKDYFEWFARVPGLKVIPGSYKPFVRTFGDIATNDGYFTFRADDPSAPNGEKIIPARFTFVYRKNDQGEWEIINHHNSAMPTPPPALKPGYAHKAPKF